MLNAKDFTTSILHSNGLSGEVLLMTSKADPSIAYAVKYEKPFHSYSEYVMQTSKCSVYFFDGSTKLHQSTIFYLHLHESDLYFRPYMVK